MVDRTYRLSAGPGDFTREVIGSTLEAREAPANELLANPSISDSATPHATNR